MHGKTTTILSLAACAALAAFATGGAKDESAKENIVFVCGHPDDTEGFAGTAFLLKENYNIHIVDLTRGERGLGEEGCRDGSTARKRVAEETEACKMLGTAPVFLDEIDGEASAGADAREKLMNILSELKPKAVFMHWPVDAHSDHVQSAALAINALYQLAREKRLYPERYFYEVLLDQTANFRPLYYVDVTSTFGLKKALLRKYECQNPGDSIVREKEYQAALRGREARPGVPFAEAFTTYDGKPMPGGVLASVAMPANLEADDAAARGIDAAAEAKAREILARMTLEEKVSILAGSGTMTLPAIPRVGIDREWQFSDSSHTVRANMERWTWNCTDTNDEATVLPTLSALAATWNTRLAEKFGDVMGEQARARGKDMMLGPGINLMRTPLCGRNWEYLSEDPFLAARMVVPEIKAMQRHGVAACVKHFCANNQENDRHNNDAVVDDRTLNEIYLPAFRAAVKEAGVWSLMTSYNLLNGIHCAENPYLLKGILRDRWGFDGLIVTDWGGQRSTAMAANSGAGDECNRGEEIRFFANPSKGGYPLADAVKKGEVHESTVDDMAFRVLYTMARTGFFNPSSRDSGSRLTKEHQDAAREIGEEAIVLLKNDNALLPLDPARMEKILVVGRLADTEMCTRGWSAEGKPLYEVTPYKGIVEYFEKLGRKVEIEKLPLVASDDAETVHPVIESSICTFDTSAKDAGMSVRAWETEWFDDTWDVSGVPFKTGFSRQPGLLSKDGKAPLDGMNDIRFAVRWKTKLLAPETGEYSFAADLDTHGGAAITLDGRRLASGMEAGRVACRAKLEKGRTYDFSVSYIGDRGEHRMVFGWRLPSEGSVTGSIRAKAAGASAVLVFTGTEVGHGRALECEGGDRPDMRLPEGHDEAIAEILSWKLPNVVIVNHSGSPVEFPWVDAAPALVQQPYLGQEAGRALARVLFGNVSPSGKLPCTWPRTYSDTPVAVAGESTPRHSIYNERFYMGYRWYDKTGTKPMFPFGYGLSYSTFALSGMACSVQGESVSISVDVENTGNRAARETVQIYASYPDSKVERVVRELKGFAKTRTLEPGESEKVVVSVPLRELAYFDTASSRFKTESGRHVFKAATSSAAEGPEKSVVLDHPRVYRD